jgi:hypothetical protein
VPKNLYVSIYYETKQIEGLTDAKIFFWLTINIDHVYVSSQSDFESILPHGGD